MKRGILLFLTTFVCLSEVTYAALNVANISNPTLGLVLSGSSGRQFILRTNGNITGADAADYITGAEEGHIRVEDTSWPRSINIVATNVSTTGGLTVTEVLCTYNNGTETVCGPGGFTVTSVLIASLRVGLDLSTSQAHVGGDSASVDFDIEIIYI